MSHLVSLKSYEVSIVVLTQGKRIELVECLRSILCQENSFFEVIVVNNSSRALDIQGIELYQDKFKLINTGGNFGTAARNVGAALASGEYLVFLDDDVVLDQNDTVVRIRSIMKRHPNRSCICFKVKSKDSENFESASWGHPRNQMEWQNKPVSYR